jgi:phosphoribosylaminoimidazolecarboxamide formyltransferase / IMP cyclohydrolase
MKVAGNALISVFDKSGIEEFAAGLDTLGWTIYASGGTKKRLEEAGITAKDAAELSGGGAILGHRVVTLSREISAGLLADLHEKADVDELKKLGIPVIDLLCVDMYPLERAIARPGSTRVDVIKDTDIGGPTLIRAAAKGNRIVLTRADQRANTLQWLRAGMPNEEAYRHELAAAAVYEVARYTAMEAAYHNGDNVSVNIARKFEDLKYGENPQQAEAAIYADNRITVDPLGHDQFKFIKGSVRTFTNFADADCLLQIATHIAAGFDRNFGTVPPIAIGMKHGNACGAAVGETIVEAVKKMIDGDVRAIFGGFIMVTGMIDRAVADALLHHSMDGFGQDRMLDGVIGAAVTDEALDILTRKKLRIVTNPALAKLSEKSLDTSRRTRHVRGAILEQPNYTFVMDLKADYVSKKGMSKLTKQQKEDMILAWAVGCVSNSNTITLVKNGMIIGNGVGQQDRVGAAQLALSRTTTELVTFEQTEYMINMTVSLDRQKLEGAVAYSDSFFPFPDGPMLLAQAGIQTILTTHGSVNDDIVMKTLADAGVTTVTIPDSVGRGFAKH